MDTINTLNHELTSGASTIDIEDMGYEMPSKSMNVDGNINDSVRNSPTLTEDDNSLQLDRDIADSGYLNEVQTSPTYLLGGISYPNESDFQFLFSGS
jgi:hypothetical protein